MILNRFYHVSSVVQSMKKQGVKLSKMLNPKSKRQFYPSSQNEAVTMPSLKSLTKVKAEPGKQATRRVAMLNKLFMKQITDLLSTGTVGMGIIGRGIEISKVQVAQNFQTVNVFWVCKGDSTDAETESLLNKTAGPLRHELSTLRAMGQVPYIMFQKDKQEARLVDLDRCLAVADYGEDYTPTDLGHLLKTEFTLNTKISPEMKAKIKQLEDEIDITDDPIPDMTHSVFGLDHAKILSRLVAARKKSRDAWNDLDAAPVISYIAPKTSADVDTEKQRKDLALFLKQRQILQNKLHKQKERGLREDFLYLDKVEDDADADADKADEAEEQSEDDYDYETQENYYTGFSPGRLHLQDIKPECGDYKA